MVDELQASVLQAATPRGFGRPGGDSSSSSSSKISTALSQHQILYTLDWRANCTQVLNELKYGRVVLLE